MNAPRIDLSIVSDLWVYLRLGRHAPSEPELGDVRDIAAALTGWLERHGRSIDEVARLLPQPSGALPAVVADAIADGAMARTLWRNARGDLIFVVERGERRTLVADLRGATFEVS